MAVPQIFGVSPSAGPSMGGNMVIVDGLNFRLPDEPPATGVAPKAAQTVEVLFGTIPADPEKIFVVQDSRLYVKAPPFPMHDANEVPLLVAQTVDVTVTNLDNNGDPIAGETVTEVDGYAFDRVDISGENPHDSNEVTSGSHW